MNQKMLGLMLGIVLTLIVVSAIGIATAHTQDTPANTSETSEKSGHSGMQCMGMDLDEMDSDNDGVCDYCGMSVELCEEMLSAHSGSEGMHKMHHKSGMHKLHQESGMKCH